MDFEKDSYDIMLSPKSSMETKSFLKLYKMALALNTNSTLIISRLRFSVEKLSYWKCRDALEHEFLVVEVKDQEGSLSTKLILERTVKAGERGGARLVEDEPSKFQTFLRHPKALDLIKTLMEKGGNLDNVPSSIAGKTAATAFTTAAVTLASDMPIASAVSTAVAGVALLLPFQGKETAPILPLTNPVEVFTPPRHSILDKATLAGSSKLHSANYFPKPSDIHAHDQWLGKDYLDSPDYANAKLMFEFSPVKINLLQLAVLAEVIQEEYPLYSIFKDQCYWFAHLVCKAILVISSLPTEVPNAEDHDVEPMFNVGFLNEQGRWKGIKVSDVTPVVLSSVLDKFWRRFDEELETVIKHSFLDFTAN